MVESDLYLLLGVEKPERPWGEVENGRRMEEVWEVWGGDEVGAGMAKAGQELRVTR